MSDFTFSDLGRVHWLGTLKLALARGFCAGLVIGLVGAAFGLSDGTISTTDALTAIGMLPVVLAALAFPVGVALQLFGLVLNWLDSVVPIGIIGLIAGLVLITGSLFLCIGDPLVYLLNRAVPRLLNVANFGFFNFRPLIFITHSD